MMGERGDRSRVFTIPNGLTALRLLLVPLFGLGWARHSPLAPWLFAVAATTDLLDGSIARLLDQKSRLGALLDPLADKALMMVSLLVGIAVDAIPIWFAAVVLGRDLLQGLAVLLLFTFWRSRFPPDRWRPSLTGKAATFFQLLAVAGALLDSYAYAALHSLLPWIMALAAATTLAAGLQYGAWVVAVARR